MRIFHEVNAKHMAGNLHLSTFLQIGWRRSNSFADFFTLGVVPLAGESYWSISRRSAVATHLQILQPRGNKRQLFI